MMNWFKLQTSITRWLESRATRDALQLALNLAIIVDRECCTVPLCSSLTSQCLLLANSALHLKSILTRATQSYLKHPEGSDIVPMTKTQAPPLLRSRAHYARNVCHFPPNFVSYCWLDNPLERRESPKKPPSQPDMNLEQVLRNIEPASSHSNFLALKAFPRGTSAVYTL